MATRSRLRVVSVSQVGTRAASSAGSAVASGCSGTGVGVSVAPAAEVREVRGVVRGVRPGELEGAPLDVADAVALGVAGAVLLGGGVAGAVLLGGGLAGVALDETGDDLGVGVLGDAFVGVFDGDGGTARTGAAVPGTRRVLPCCQASATAPPSGTFRPVTPMEE